MLDLELLTDKDRLNGDIVFDKVLMPISNIIDHQRDDRRLVGKHRLDVRAKSDRRGIGNVIDMTLPLIDLQGQWQYLGIKCFGFFQVMGSVEVDDLLDLKMHGFSYSN